MQKDNNFTEGNILSALIKFAVPIFIALCLQAMYGAADLLIVGRFGDASGVSAVGTGSEIMLLVTVIISGLTMGSTVMIGMYIGKKSPSDAASSAGAAVMLFIAVAAVLTVLMTALARPLTVLMRAPNEAFSQTVSYVRICSYGIVFITAYNGISGIFRGLGNSRLPMIFVAVACAVNIMGDLLLVGVFKLGASGAAIATISAQALSVIISLIIIYRSDLPFKLTKKDIRFNKKEIAAIVKVGSPIALEDALTHLSFLLINAIINNFGVYESAGYGIANRVIAFIFLVPSSVMSAVTAIVATNIGANKPERAKKVMFTAMEVGLALGIFMFAAGFFAGGFLSSAFSDDKKVIYQAADYLRGFSADCLLTCVLFSFMGYFNGCGKTMYVMAQGVTASMLVRFPLSYLFSVGEGATLFRIGLASPISTVYGIIFCIVCFKIMNAKKMSTKSL